MPFEDPKILQLNKYQKSDKVQFVIFADLECLAVTTDECKNNPKMYTHQK